MNLIRIDIINHKLKLIEENIELVKRNLPDNLEDFKKLGLIKDGIYKRIESSIQEILSICAIMNSDLKLGIPEDRDDVIAILIENEIITNDIGNIIKNLKGFRNFLIYKYGYVQDKIAFEDIKNGIDDFQLVKKEIIKFIENEKKE